MNTPLVNVEYNIFSLQLLLQKGTSYVDMFRYATEPYLVEIFKERIEPYLDTYPTVNIQSNSYIYIYIYITIQYSSNIWNALHKLVTITEQKSTYRNIDERLFVCGVW